ncbi:DUF2218 domain-containing protein [Leisingera sp. ANG-Vp]|uniref:DUF2218 domain-containing protein n=1 Tax=Leisingera sp. ANG-Vp TaxID=1577896 RepID=UPI00057F58B0|nr:DUF2218 domain-containing protein [Leisingera sp. ANG-Vp]KIC20021.1 2,4-dihydroxyhept-2-ene-1,7-dioic acid aldolase [Leisingera sp. ANG-Vp]
MLNDQGRFETPNAEKYLQQLCKHFSHKVDVQFDTRQGTIALGTGPAALHAADGVLAAEISAPDAAELNHARQIIDTHLARFAFREDFEGMAWQSGAAPATA